MIKKKLEFQEEIGSSKAEVSIRQISKKNLNNSVDLKEGEISKNYSVEDNTKYTNKQVRGRQLYPNNIYTYSKKNNSSLATTCESKKRIGRKKELIKDIKNKTFPQRGNYFYGDDFSGDSASDGSQRNRRRGLKEKKYYCTESNKRLNRNRFDTFPESLSESKEFNISKENRESSEDIVYDDNNDDNYENIDIDNLSNEIQKILIDIYNTHINPEKAKNRSQILNHERYIESISLNLDKHYNIFILQILSEKIKELVKRYKEKILDIEDIKSIKMKYQEVIEKSFSNTANGKNTPIVFFKSKNNRNKNVWVNKEKENLVAMKKDEILPFTDKNWEALRTLLRELTNIKIALMTSSADIEKVFKSPLSHLRINDKIVTFCIQDMHKEEFYSTLLEDEFISYLIKQIKAKAKENKLDQFLKLIENLEFDCFVNNNTNNNKNEIDFNSNNIDGLNYNNNGNQTFSKEMTRFSLFLDNQLKEIIEQQNVLERQFQNIKANNNINNLNNLNNLINLKNNALNFYNFSGKSNQNNCTGACQENMNTSSNSNSINTSNISNGNFPSECSNHHFSASFNCNSKKHAISNNTNTNVGQNNINMNFLNNNNLISTGSNINVSNSQCKNNKINFNSNLNNNNHNHNHNHSCCATNSNYNVLSSGNKINFSCNTSNLNNSNNNIDSINNSIHGKSVCNNHLNANSDLINNINNNSINNDLNNNNNNQSVNNNKNDKFNDIDALVAYINTNEDSKTKKNKKKNTKKKNQNQKVLQNVNNSGIYDELVVENFRKNIYKDSCAAENVRKVKPVFSMEWLNSINNIVK